MPTFGFAAAKKPLAKTSNSPSTKYSILFKDVIGTVIITLQGEYKVKVGESLYEIAPESYSCKNIAEIYEVALHDENLSRVRHIRSEKDKTVRDNTLYLPFTAGCTAKGNVVIHTNSKFVYFKSKKIYLDNDDHDGKKAIKFYRDNYATINKALNKNIIDTYVPEDEQLVHGVLTDNEEVIDGTQSSREE